MLILIIILLFLAFGLLWLSSGKLHAAGLPGGQIIASDTQSWKPLEKPLYDPILNLTGKPDYLVEQGYRLIPVEIKTSRVTDAPYDSHIYQLIAYCVLVEKTYGNRPPYGILHYPDRNFAIDYSPDMEKAFLNILNDMRAKMRKRYIIRSHQSSSRCIQCGYKKICDQSLA